MSWGSVDVNHIMSSKNSKSLAGNRLPVLGNERFVVWKLLGPIHLLKA